MKKEMKHYESPKMEVIEINKMVLLAGSDSDNGTIPGIGDGGNGF